MAQAASSLCKPKYGASFCTISLDKPTKEVLVFVPNRIERKTRFNDDELVYLHCPFRLVYTHFQKDEVQYKTQ